MGDLMFRENGLPLKGVEDKPKKNKQRGNNRKIVTIIVIAGVLISVIGVIALPFIPHSKNVMVNKTTNYLKGKYGTDFTLVSYESDFVGIEGKWQYDMYFKDKNGIEIHVDTDNNLKDIFDNYTSAKLTTENEKNVKGMISELIPGKTYVKYNCYADTFDESKDKEFSKKTYKQIITENKDYVSENLDIYIEKDNSNKEKQLQGTIDYFTYLYNLDLEDYNVRIHYIKSDVPDSLFDIQDAYDFQYKIHDFTQTSVELTKYAYGNSAKEKYSLEDNIDKIKELFE